MADFDDLQLDKSAAPPPPPQPRWVPILALVVLLAGLAGVWYYLRQSSELDPSATAATEQAIPQGTASAPDTSAADTDLPPLNETDPVVRELMRALSQHPVVAAWLTTDQLIRTFTVSVVNVAEGDTPARHLYTIRPQERFEPRGERGRPYLDPQSYRRFDSHAAAFAEIEPAGAARLYERLKPRIEDAYGELAGPSATFDRTLERAFIELLGTPIVEGPIALESRVERYVYADPRLESLSRAQQQLLRMGPDNVRLVQEKLRAIAQQLGISEASLPQPRIIRMPGASGSTS